jgi:hypothetical protein
MPRIRTYVTGVIICCISLACLRFKVFCEYVFIQKKDTMRDLTTSRTLSLLVRYRMHRSMSDVNAHRWCPLIAQPWHLACTYSLKTTPLFPSDSRGTVPLMQYLFSERICEWKERTANNKIRSMSRPEYVFTIDQILKFYSLSEP